MKATTCAAGSGKIFNAPAVITPSVRFGGVLNVLQRDAGLHFDRVVGRIELTHAVQSRERQNQCLAGGVRRGATRKSGVAAVRHDGNAVW
jgi:hypothetical protein